MEGDTEHLRVIAGIYRETWGAKNINATYIEWAADEIERLRKELYMRTRSLEEAMKQQ